MDRSKRDFMSAILPVALVAPFVILETRAAAQEEGRHQRVQPVPQPQQPDVSPAEPPKFDQKLIQQENQKKIQQDIQKLYALAGELKEQVEKTDSTNVLSLSLVDKANKIEKLARQIATLARG
ncbi:MAG: hypothetical protein ACRD5M_02750 [Candidatus Acidiferrales bacterium]